MQSLPKELVRLVDSFIKDIKDKVRFRLINRRHYLILYKIRKPKKEIVSIEKTYDVDVADGIYLNIDGYMKAKIHLPLNEVRIDVKGKKIEFDTDFTYQCIKGNKIYSESFVCNEPVGTSIEVDTLQLIEIKEQLSKYYKHWPKAV